MFLTYSRTQSATNSQLIWCYRVKKASASTREAANTNVSPAIEFVPDFLKLGYLLEFELLM
jgi:hypothetical protein